MRINRDPKVTVLMSVYNNETTVATAIESILNQTFAGFEFIIINDRSADNSLKVIKSFSDKRIKLIENSSNLGLTKSLNKGLDAAAGTYIARMDSDDISEISRLEKQVAFMEENKDFVILGSSYRIINKGREIIREVLYDLGPEKIYYDLLFQNMFAHASVIFRLDKARELGGYNENYRFAQDYDLWCRLALKGKIWVMPDILISWTQDERNISGTNLTGQQKVSREVFNNNFKDLNISETKLQELEYFHNFYDNDFFKIPGNEIREAFNSLKYANSELIKNAPLFYNRKKLSFEAYNTLIYMLALLYKNNINRRQVIKFLVSNFHDFEIDRALLKKIFKIKQIKARK